MKLRLGIVNTVTLISNSIWHLPKIVVLDQSRNQEYWVVDQRHTFILSYRRSAAMKYSSRTKPSKMAISRWYLMSFVRQLKLLRHSSLCKTRLTPEYLVKRMDATQIQNILFIIYWFLNFANIFSGRYSGSCDMVFKLDLWYLDWNSTATYIL